MGKGARGEAERCPGRGAGATTASGIVNGAADAFGGMGQPPAYARGKFITGAGTPDYAYKDTGL